MIPEEIVNRIREATDIVQVVSQTVVLKKAGANYKGLCPFHNEKTPSFTVHPGKQIYHCFGCGQGGNVFRFLMTAGKMTFPEVLQELAGRAGIALPQDKLGGGEEDEARAKRREALLGLLELAAGWYRRVFETSPEAEEARAYAARRGLSAEILEKFRIGYSPEEGRTLVSAALAKGYGEDQLEEAGLLGRGENGRTYARFRGRLMFPIVNALGKTVGFGGRLLKEGEPKYLNSPETAVFAKGSLCFALPQAKEEMARRGQALVVEGYMDALACHQAGVSWCVATLGTAMGESHARLLKRYAQDVSLLFDSDTAGLNAARRGCEILVAAGLNVKVVRLRGAKDPDELIQKQGKQAFLDQVAAGQEPPEFCLDLALGGQADPPLRDRVDGLKSLFPLVAKYPTEMEADAHLRRAAARLQLNPESVLADFKSFQKGQEPKALAGLLASSMKGDGPARRSESEGGTRQEKELLALLVEHPAFVAEAAAGLSPEDFSGATHREAAAFLWQHPGTALAELDSVLPAGSVLPGFLSSLTREPPHRYPEKSLEELTRGIRREGLIRGNAARAEALKDPSLGPDRLKELQQKISDVSKEIEKLKTAKAD